MDLTKLTEQDLKIELARRKEKKDEDRKTYKNIVDEVIPFVMEKIKEESERLSLLKKMVFEHLRDLLDLKIGCYDTKADQQSHTFSDHKGNSITYGFRVVDDWDDTVNEGVMKVRDFISTLAVDEKTGKLVDVINRLLRKDAKGNLKASRILELQNLAEEINDAVFTDAVDIIKQSYKPVKSVFYIEASFKDAQGKKIYVPLSISTVDFPENTDVDSLFPVSDRY